MSNNWYTIMKRTLIKNNNLRIISVLKTSGWNLYKHVPSAKTFRLAITFPHPTFILKSHHFLPFKKLFSVARLHLPLCRSTSTNYNCASELKANRLKMNVIDHVRDLAAAGLHSNVRIISSLLLTMSTNNPWVSPS